MNKNSNDLAGCIGVLIIIGGGAVVGCVIMGPFTLWIFITIGVAIIAG